MNNNRPAAAGHRAVGKSSGLRRRPAENGARPAPAAAALAPEARRLLEVLADPAARLVRDPFDAERLIATRRAGSVSLPAGRYRREAGEALVRHDLARWGSSARTSLAITGAGAAYLRRAAAGRAEDPARDPFLEQHIASAEALVETAEGVARVRVDAEESPLDWLRRRRGRDGAPLIDEAAFAAGERLRRDVTVAGLLPSVTARWEAPRGGGAVGPAAATDAMIAARQRLRQAFVAIGGEFADLLLDLCGFGKGLATIERERGWPPRSGKVAIRLALARLAEHYGLAAAASGPKASRGIRAWQAVLGEEGNALMQDSKT